MIQLNLDEEKIYFMESITSLCKNLEYMINAADTLFYRNEELYKSDIEARNEIENSLYYMETLLEKLQEIEYLAEEISFKRTTDYMKHRESNNVTEGNDIYENEEDEENAWIEYDCDISDIFFEN